MDAQQIFAYTELKGPLPAYLNVSRPAYGDNGAVGPLVEVPDVVVTVRERRAQDNGADRPVSYCGVTARISVPMAELAALYVALGEFLQAANAAAHELTADLFAPQEGDALPDDGERESDDEFYARVDDEAAYGHSGVRVVLPGDETPEERITFDNPRAAADEG